MTRDPLQTLADCRAMELPPDPPFLWRAGSENHRFEKRRRGADLGFVHEEFDDLPLYERLLCTNMDCRWQNMKPGTDLVYFVQGTPGTPIKIGTTDSGRVRARVKQLQTGHPFPLRVLRTVRGGKQLESDVHRMFADYRLSGEWFAPEPVVLALVGQSKYGDGNTGWAYREGYQAGLRAGRERHFRAGVAWAQRRVRRRLADALESLPREIESASLMLQGYRFYS